MNVIEIVLSISLIIVMIAIFFMMKVSKTNVIYSIYGSNLKKFNRKECLIQIIVVWFCLVIMSLLFKLNSTYSVLLSIIVTLTIPIIFHFQSQALSHAYFYNQITTFLQHFLAHFKLHHQTYHALIDVRLIMNADYQNLIDIAIKEVDINSSNHPLTFLYRLCPHFIVLNIMSWIQHVEEYGMDQSYEILDMLENDIDDWIEDSTMFIKRIHETKNKILVLVGLSLLIALFNQHMLSSFMNVAQNDVYQVTIFAFLCVLIITVVKAFQTLNTSWILRSEYLCKE